MANCEKFVNIVRGFLEEENKLEAGQKAEGSNEKKEKETALPSCASKDGEPFKLFN